MTTAKGNADGTTAKAKAAGVVFYGLPEELTGAEIDPLIWPAVRRINESGWCWTAESCQGHPDSEDSTTWARNTKPMLRLVCTRAHLGRMMACLIAAATGVPDDSGDHPLLTHDFALELWPRRVGGNVGDLAVPDWCEILVYLPAATVYERNQGLRVFERFAEAVCAP